MKINLLLMLFVSMIAINTNAQLYDLDATFNNSGKAIVDFNNGFDGGYTIQVADNKEVFLFGYSNDINGQSSMALVNFTADGSIDSNFANGGKFIYNENSTIGKAMILLKSGKILLTGKMNLNGDNVWAFIRLNANGSLDNTWDADGLLIIDAGGFSDEPSKMIELPNGKILAIGTGSQNGNGSDFCLIRLNGNGSKDALFGVDGISHLNINGGLDVALDAVVLNDGKILVCGRSIDGSGKPKMALAKFNSNGNHDSTFGSNGMVLLEHNDVGSSQGNSLIVENDHIFTTGLLSIAGQSDSFLSFISKHDINGQIINSFGSNGIKILDNNSYGTKIIRHFNGSLLIAGSTDFDASLINIDTDGNLLTDFGDFGKMIIKNSTAIDELNDVVEIGNNIYALGTGLVTNFNDTDMFVLKLVDPLNTSVDNAIEEPIKIFPNPAYSNANITIESNHHFDKIHLIDMYGQKHLIQAYDNQIKLPPTISKGNYIVCLISEEKSIYSKIIIE